MIILETNTKHQTPKTLNKQWQQIHQSLPET